MTTTHATDTSITTKSFGTTSGGEKVTQYTLTNSKGSSVSIINYGGIVTALRVPDRNGKIADVVLVFKTLAEYEKPGPYFGALIGRYGNRIAKGEFTLARKTYHLARNNNGQSLHGGLKGFEKVIWNATPVETRQGPSLKLTYVCLLYTSPSPRD